MTQTERHVRLFRNGRNHFEHAAALSAGHHTLSDLTRCPQGTVATRIAATGEDTVCTSIIVAVELRFGAAKSGSRKLADRIDLILSALAILPLETPADRYYLAPPVATPTVPASMELAARAELSIILYGRKRVTPASSFS